MNLSILVPEDRCPMFISRGFLLDVLYKLPEGRQLLRPLPNGVLYRGTKVVGRRKELIPKPPFCLLSVLGHYPPAVDLVVVPVFYIGVDGHLLNLVSAQANKNYGEQFLSDCSGKGN